MSLSKAIYKILSSESELTDLTSTRIFPSVIPQNVDYPALMYEIDSQEPMYVKDRRHQKTEAHIVIGVHGKTYSDVQNVSEVIIATLEKYKDETDTDFVSAESGISGVPPTGGCSIVEGYWIQEVFFDNSFDLFDEKLRVFEKYIEFDVRFLNNPASMGAFAWYGGTVQGLLSTNLQVRTLPTSDGNAIALAYSGAGDSTLNLTQGSESGASAKPTYRTDGALRFDMESATDPQARLEVSATDGIDFTDGCTIFMVLKKNAVNNTTIFPIFAPAISGGVSSSLVRIFDINATNYVYIQIGGQLALNLGGTSVPSFENKTYIAFSWGKTGDETGEYQIIDPLGDTIYSSKKVYTDYSGSSTGTFRFKMLGVNGGGSGTFDLFDCVMFNKKLTFGGGQYNRIKDYLLNKHNL
tara:strand:+ start:202 stop:1431 length:1230 start_codon:yes stop_codon:yes gene_type:complete